MDSPSMSIQSSRTRPEVTVDRVSLVLLIHRECVCVCVSESLSHVQLCNPMDCSPSGSSVHGIFQARILEWETILFSRGSSRFRDQTQVSCVAGRFFTISATGEAH